MENIAINISIGELLKSSWRKCGILSTVTFCLTLWTFITLMAFLRITATVISLFWIVLFTSLFMGRLY